LDAALHFADTVMYCVELRSRTDISEELLSAFTHDVQNTFRTTSGAPWCGIHFEVVGAKRRSKITRGFVSGAGERRSAPRDAVRVGAAITGIAVAECGILAAEFERRRAVFCRRPERRFGPLKRPMDIRAGSFMRVDASKVRGPARA